MKYEVGQILYAIDPCAMKSDGRTTLTVGKGYEIIGNDAIYKELTVIDDEKSDHSFGYDEAAKYFSTEKNLNGGTINTKDHRQEPDNGKYSPEQIAYLDQCAIAAMAPHVDFLMRNPVDEEVYPERLGELSKRSHDIAEAMLQEKTKRLSDK